jgi:hypothetical protein
VPRIVLIAVQPAPVIRQFERHCGLALH